MLLKDSIAKKNRADAELKKEIAKGIREKRHKPLW